MVLHPWSRNAIRVNQWSLFARDVGRKLRVLAIGDLEKTASPGSGVWLGKARIASVRLDADLRSFALQRNMKHAGNRRTRPMSAAAKAAVIGAQSVAGERG